MKKILALLLAVVMVVGLVACGNKDEDKKSGETGGNAAPANNPKIEAFVKEQGQAFVDGVAQGFSGSGMTCKSSIEAKGEGVLVKIRIDGVDNISEEDKTAMQQNIDATSASLSSALASLKTAVPEIQFMELHLCEQDGDLLAKTTIK